MKRYRLVYRGLRDAYYSFDIHTKKRESLGTNNTDEAQRLLDIKNEAVQHAEMNLQIAQVYLQHSDPTLSARTWQDADDLFGFVRHFFVVMRYKLGEDNAAARQEVFHCLLLFHLLFLWLANATGDATTFAVGFTNDLSVAVSNPAGRAGGVAVWLHIGLAGTDAKAPPLWMLLAPR